MDSLQRRNTFRGLAASVAKDTKLFENLGEVLSDSAIHELGNLAHALRNLVDNAHMLVLVLPCPGSSGLEMSREEDK